MSWYEWKYFSGRWWLILGILSYLSTFLSSIFRAWNTEVTFALNLTMVFDWFAACVVYFFLGAMLGVIIDLIVAHFSKKKFAIPIWFWYTLGLWVISVLYIAFVATPQMVDSRLIPIFPLPYGIFYTGGAFFVLAKSLVQLTFWGKSVLDIIYTALFGWWFYLAVYKAEQQLRKQTILVSVLFIVLLIGLFGFAHILP